MQCKNQNDVAKDLLLACLLVEIQIVHKRDLHFASLWVVDVVLYYDRRRVLCVIFCTLALVSLVTLVHHHPIEESETQPTLFKWAPLESNTRRPYSIARPGLVRNRPPRPNFHSFNSNKDKRPYNRRRRRRRQRKRQSTKGPRPHFRPPHLSIVCIQQPLRSIR